MSNVENSEINTNVTKSPVTSSATLGLKSKVTNDPVTMDYPLGSKSDGITDNGPTVIPVTTGPDTDQMETQTTIPTPVDGQKLKHPYPAPENAKRDIFVTAKFGDPKPYQKGIEGLVLIVVPKRLYSCCYYSENYTKQATDFILRLHFIVRISENYYMSKHDLLTKSALSFFERNKIHVLVKDPDIYTLALTFETNPNHKRRFFQYALPRIIAPGRNYPSLEICSNWMLNGFPARNDVGFTKSSLMNRSIVQDRIEDDGRPTQYSFTSLVVGSDLLYSFQVGQAGGVWLLKPPADLPSWTTLSGASLESVVLSHGSWFCVSATLPDRSGYSPDTKVMFHTTSTNSYTFPTISVDDKIFVGNRYGRAIDAYLDLLVQDAEHKDDFMEGSYNPYGNGQNYILILCNGNREIRYNTRATYDKILRAYVEKHQDEEVFDCSSQIMFQLSTATDVVSKRALQAEFETSRPDFKQNDRAAVKKKKSEDIEGELKKSKWPEKKQILAERKNDIRKSTKSFVDMAVERWSLRELAIKVINKTLSPSTYFKIKARVIENNNDIMACDPTANPSDFSRYKDNKTCVSMLKDVLLSDREGLSIKFTDDGDIEIVGGIVAEDEDSSFDVDLPPKPKINKSKVYATKTTTPDPNRTLHIIDDTEVKSKSAISPSPIKKKSQPQDENVESKDQAAIAPIVIKRTTDEPIILKDADVANPNWSTVELRNAPVSLFVNANVTADGKPYRLIKPDTNDYRLTLMEYITKMIPAAVSNQALLAPLKFLPIQDQLAACYNNYCAYHALDGEVKAMQDNPLAKVKAMGLATEKQKYGASLSAINDQLGALIRINGGSNNTKGNEQQDAVVHECLYDNSATVHEDQPSLSADQLGQIRDVDTPKDNINYVVIDDVNSNNLPSDMAKSASLSSRVAQLIWPGNQYIGAGYTAGKHGAVDNDFTIRPINYEDRAARYHDYLYGVLSDKVEADRLTLARYPDSYAIKGVSAYNKLLSYFSILVCLVLFMEGSFNPYGNGQTSHPSTIAIPDTDPNDIIAALISGRKYIVANNLVDLFMTNMIHITDTVTGATFVNYTRPTYFSLHFCEPSIGCRDIYANAYRIVAANPLECHNGLSFGVTLAGQMPYAQTKLSLNWTAAYLNAIDTNARELKYVFSGTQWSGLNTAATMQDILACIPYNGSSYASVLWKLLMYYSQINSPIESDILVDATFAINPGPNYININFDQTVGAIIDSNWPYGGNYGNNISAVWIDAENWSSLIAGRTNPLNTAIWDGANQSGVIYIPLPDMWENMGENERVCYVVNWLPYPFAVTRRQYSGVYYTNGCGLTQVRHTWNSIIVFVSSKKRATVPLWVDNTGAFITLNAGNTVSGNLVVVHNTTWGNGGLRDFFYTNPGNKTSIYSSVWRIFGSLCTPQEISSALRMWVASGTYIIPPTRIIDDGFAPVSSDLAYIGPVTPMFATGASALTLRTRFLPIHPIPLETGRAQNTTNAIVPVPSKNEVLYRHMGLIKPTGTDYVRVTALDNAAIQTVYHFLANHFTRRVHNISVKYDMPYDIYTNPSYARTPATNTPGYVYAATCDIWTSELDLGLLSPKQIYPKFYEPAVNTVVTSELALPPGLYFGYDLYSFIKDFKYITDPICRIEQYIKNATQAAGVNCVIVDKQWIDTTYTLLASIDFGNDAFALEPKAVNSTRGSVVVPIGAIGTALRRNTFGQYFVTFPASIRFFQSFFLLNDWVIANLDHIAEQFIRFTQVNMQNKFTSPGIAVFLFGSSEGLNTYQLGMVTRDNVYVTRAQDLTRTLLDNPDTNPNNPNVRNGLIEVGDVKTDGPDAEHTLNEIQNENKN